MLARKLPEKLVVYSQTSGDNKLVNTKFESINSSQGINDVLANEMSSKNNKEGAEKNQIKL